MYWQLGWHTNEGITVILEMTWIYFQPACWQWESLLPASQALPLIRYMINLGQSQS